MACHRTEPDAGRIALSATDLPSRLQLPPGPWTTLLDGLCARFPRVSRETWTHRFERGRVQDAHGRPLAATAAYRVGAEIRYFREVPDEPPIPFEETVLHVDEHLVVADKPHFLPVTPAGAHVRETLLARLVARLGNPHLVPLHRIDRDTAGLVLFSAEPRSRGAYQSLFRERRIAKRYEARAPALPALAFPRTRVSRIEPGAPFPRMHEVEGAPNSETRIEVIGRAADVWRYALSPITGRKHQLRVHMAALGAPILGDPLYASGGAGEGGHSRPLQLLARMLSFDDPITGRTRTFVSERELAGAGE
jgi:tRNA pseudouridine32 synthase/23S rRNA pseudouridine746 synthase